MNGSGRVVRAESVRLGDWLVIRMVDGSVREGPVYGGNGEGRALMCRGVRIADKEVVVEMRRMAMAALVREAAHA